jgi:hypothetical protein
MGKIRDVTKDKDMVIYGLTLIILQLKESSAFSA